MRKLSLSMGLFLFASYIVLKKTCLVIWSELKFSAKKKESSQSSDQLCNNVLSGIWLIFYAVNMHDAWLNIG